MSIKKKINKKRKDSEPILFDYFQIVRRGCPRGVMVKAMDCGIVVREFVLQSCYYVHLGKI